VLRANCTRRGDALHSDADEVPARAFMRSDMALGEVAEQSLSDQKTPIRAWSDDQQLLLCEEPHEYTTCGSSQKTAERRQDVKTTANCNFLSCSAAL
jgi:hypothetical protein